MKRKYRASGAAVGAIAMGLLLALPATALAAESDHGGAARNDGDKSAEVSEAIVSGPAKNVILLIGDGMGDSEITVARNYVHGASGEFPGIDALPLTGQYTTYSLDADTGRPNYTPDSAATGTAWATGTKSYNGAIGVDIHDVDQPTLLELAKIHGKKTGNVSTAEIQDATPAVQVSHVSQRKCYGPEATSEKCAADARENGGKGSISEQLLDVRPDVTLGGGSASFNEVAKAGAYAGMTLFEQAQLRGYTLVDNADELAAVSEANQATPLLGLFTSGNFPVRWQGAIATEGGADAGPLRCEDNPERLSSGLSLASLTQKAIDLLDSDEGFFLQVEGASIDKQDHAANACGQIGETVDLDEAVRVALDYAEKDGNTLVVVTADHAHTSQIVGDTPPGLSVQLETNEGQPMIVSYGTAPAGGSQQHTGAQVRIAGYGPGAADVVGLVDQTDVFFTTQRMLELNGTFAEQSADASAVVPTEPVAPEGKVTVGASGFHGDWTAEVRVAGQEPREVDVINGAFTVELDAPSATGPVEVSIVGKQSSATVSASFVVAENGGGVVTPGEGSQSGQSGAEEPQSGTAAAGIGGLSHTGLDGNLIVAIVLCALVLCGVGYGLIRSRGTGVAVIHD